MSGHIEKAAVGVLVCSRVLEILLGTISIDLKTVTKNIAAGKNSNFS